MSDENKSNVSGSSSIRFLVVGVIALILGGLLVYFLFPNTKTETITQVTGNATQAEIDAAVAAAATSKDTQISNLQKQVNDLKAQLGISGDGTVIRETGGYLIDDLFLETAYASKIFSDREISLFDGKVDFDGEDYDADETFTLGALVVKANSNDFEGNAYLTVPANSLSYAMTFESGLDTSKIGVDDETLTFDLLGKEVEVLKWGLSSVTFVSGKSFLLSEGESVTVEGKNVTLDYATNDYAYVVVSGIGSKVNEGQTKTINGLQVRTSLTLEGTSTRASKAELRIAKEVETIVDDGDEYETDSPWVWAISTSSIGLKLNEAYTGLDEDFSALAKNDEICLPNKYVCVRYNGLADVEREKYTFDIENTNWLIARGDFVSGTNDYTKVYISRINGTIWDKLTSGKVELSNVKLGSTDSTLVTNSSDITINDFVVSLDLNSTNIGSHDYGWMTNFGIFVENTKTALEDFFFTITVPDEKVSGSMTVKDINYKQEEAVTNSTVTNSTA